MLIFLLFINYVIVSENLFPSFSIWYICDPNIVSDHCVINFVLNMCNMGNKSFDELNADSIKVESKFTWDTTESEEYKRILASDNTIESLNVVFQNLNNNCTDKQVEDSVNSFVEVLDSVCKPLFEQNIPCDNQCQVSDRMLFNEACDHNMLISLNRLNKYRNTPNEEK